MATNPLITEPIAGTVTATIAGTVTTTIVSGTVAVSNFPATQAVTISSGSVSIIGTVPVTGTIAATLSGTQTVQSSNVSAGTTITMVGTTSSTITLFSVASLPNAVVDVYAATVPSGGTLTVTLYGVEPVSGQLTSPITPSIVATVNGYAQRIMARGPLGVEVAIVLSAVSTATITLSYTYALQML